MEGIYNKKVLELFRNPKNMGEMKNPDAVGIVGNPTCLLPNEKIFLNNEFGEIQKAKRNDEVISHSVKRNEIINVFKRRYSGKVITLKNSLGKIAVTPEHLVYAIKLPKHYNYFRTRYKKDLIASWYHAKDLEKRDIVLYPIIKEVKNIKDIDLAVKKSVWDFRSKRLPEKIALGSDLLRLFGYFLSEGNIQEKPSKTYISFSLNIKEEDIINDISGIVKKLFGLDIIIRRYSERHTVMICLYNAQLARIFKKLFGNGAGKKKLPESFLKLPLEKQKALIYGLWKGDGYINLSRDGARAGYSTISYQLAQQIKMILLRLGIIPSIYIDKPRIKDGVNHKQAYRIHVGQRDSLIRLCKILNIKYCLKSYGSVTSWFDENFVYVPITGIEKKKYNKYVYNLEVEGEHSFISEAFLLHNCGDVMKIYLKIEDNKIKNIKFQTMGCAAAIATSSMVTELAKGKTLEEAKKISNKDVADALGQLPPMKMHCSNLAANALRKAIENWEKK